MGNHSLYALWSSIHAAPESQQELVVNTEVQLQSFLGWFVQCLWSLSTIKIPLVTLGPL